VRLDDQLGGRVPLLLRHNFTKFGIVVGCLEALVAFFLRGITPPVDKSVFRADAQLRIALLQNPVPDIRNPVPFIDGGCAVGEARC